METAAELLFVASPLGELGIAASERAVTGLFFGRELPAALAEAQIVGYGAASPLLREAAGQIEAYFAGVRREFTLPLELQGTPFQQEVWEAVRRIPYGEVRSYARIAAAIGRPGASRAVGMANHRNPAVILVPCHRVVGSDGSLTGYAGGLEAKRLLLALERDNRCDEGAGTALPKETLF